MTICGGQRDAPRDMIPEDKLRTRRGAVHSIGWLWARPGGVSGRLLPLGCHPQGVGIREVAVVTTQFIHAQSIFEDQLQAMLLLPIAAALH